MVYPNFKNNNLFFNPFVRKCEKIQETWILDFNNKNYTNCTYEFELANKLAILFSI
jgi:hypothetical protein